MKTRTSRDLNEQIPSPPLSGDFLLHIYVPSNIRFLTFQVKEGHYLYLLLVDIRFLIPLGKEGIPLKGYGGFGERTQIL